VFCKALNSTIQVAYSTSYQGCGAGGQKISDGWSQSQKILGGGIGA